MLGIFVFKILLNRKQEIVLSIVPEGLTTDNKKHDEELLFTNMIARESETKMSPSCSAGTYLIGLIFS